LIQAVPAHTAAPVPFPVRGVPGGWRDPWDGPEETDQIRAETEAFERQVVAHIAIIGRERRREVAAENANVR
jgi:hypothetical protein